MKGRWRDHYRAIGKEGDTLDFHGFAVMRMLRKDQVNLWVEALGGGSEVRFI